MQVISGKYKNQKINTLDDEHTHPMGSREKLALFNMISTYLPESRVLDAFAGSGALDGFFRFTGEASAISVTGNGGRLSSKPNLDDVVNGDCLKGLAKVEMNFPEAKPNAARYDVCAAGDLTAEEAALIAVSVKLPNGDVADDWKATVVNGRLSVKNPHPGGCVIYFR